MKIYCSCCDKVQPVRIDNCRDAKTNEPYQDIVCAECNLVIASGTDIQREWVGLTNEDWNSTPYDTEFRAGAEWAEAKLKERTHD